MNSQLYFVNSFFNMCRHFISGGVYMIFYHSKWNFIFVKMTDMTSIPALSFKRTCPLNTTSNKSAFIYFISFRVNCVRKKISRRFEISFRSKWPIWNPCRFEFHFTPIHVNTSKELTEHLREIFNRNEISYRSQFISPLMWTYSKSVELPHIAYIVIH